MDLLLAVGATALVVASVAFVLGCHWQEQHGDNHF